MCGVVAGCQLDRASLCCVLLFLPPPPFFCHRYLTTYGGDVSVFMPITGLYIVIPPMLGAWLGLVRGGVTRGRRKGGGWLLLCGRGGKGAPAVSNHMGEVKAVSQNVLQLETAWLLSSAWSCHHHAGQCCHGLRAWLAVSVQACCGGRRRRTPPSWWALPCPSQPSHCCRRVPRTPRGMVAAYPWALL